MQINGLECDLIEPKDYEKTVIMVNGLNQSRKRPQITKLTQPLIDAGFCLLKWDYRSHTSGNPTKTITEDLNDLMSLIDHIGECGVYGTSWGGQIALQAAPRSNKIKAVVARVPVTDLEYFKSHKERTSPPFVLDYSQDFDRYNTYEDAPKSKVPTLIFSGTTDESCLLGHHRKLFKLMDEPKKLVVYEGPHDPDDEETMARFGKDAIEWFNRYL